MPRASFMTGARVGGPILGALVAAAVPMAPPGKFAAGTAVLMATWWLTQAVPLSATALLPIVLFPVLGVLDVRAATAPYASDLIFLFLGGFILGLAFERTGLHRRVALVTLVFVGGGPAAIVGGLMLATACMSMWVSNTATTLMMLPIATGVVGLVRARAPGGDAGNFATGLLLAVAYAASIGGLGTLIGSPPNVVFAGFIERRYGVEVPFARWMALGVPLAAVFLLLAWGYLTRIAYPVRSSVLPGGHAVFREELRALGPLSRAERRIMGVFGATVLLWVLRGPLTRALAPHVPAIAGLSDAGIAVGAAVSLFLIPAGRGTGERLMDWETAEHLPWGILLLFGGGLSLSEGLRATGVDGLVGSALSGASGLHPLLIVLLVTMGVIFLTELTSNTAVAAALMPVLAAAAGGLGVDPLLLLLPAALAASCGFMLPVATPPNTIVFGTGGVTPGQMARAGWWLNLVGLALITGAVYLLGKPLLRLNLTPAEGGVP